MLGGSALAKAPKLGTQSPYFYRFKLGNAEVSVVSDGPLPLGPPKGTFIGVSDGPLPLGPPKGTFIGVPMKK